MTYPGIASLFDRMPDGASLARYREDGRPGEWHALHWDGAGATWMRGDGDTPMAALTALLGGGAEPGTRDARLSGLLYGMERAGYIVHWQDDRRGAWAYHSWASGVWGHSGWAYANTPEGALGTYIAVPDEGDEA